MGQEGHVGPSSKDPYDTTLTFTGQRDSITCSQLRASIVWYQNKGPEGNSLPE